MSAPGGFPVPARPVRHEISVRRSRFVATVDRASSADEARSRIDAIRREFPGATHHCWAFQAGAPGSSGAVGMSDSGEPHGTAGRPMLDVLLGAEVGEVVAVVSRWFGGVKLGKGGLARAYSTAVAEALERLPTTLRVEAVELAIEVAYDHVEALRRLLGDHSALTLAERYSERVRYNVSLPASRFDAFRQELMGVTSGRATIEARHDEVHED